MSASLCIFPRRRRLSSRDAAGSRQRRPFYHPAHKTTGGVSLPLHRAPLFRSTDSVQLSRRYFRFAARHCSWRCFCVPSLRLRLSSSHICAILRPSLSRSPSVCQRLACPSPALDQSPGAEAGNGSPFAQRCCCGGRASMGRAGGVKKGVSRAGERTQAVVRRRNVMRYMARTEARGQKIYINTRRRLCRGEKTKIPMGWHGRGLLIALCCRSCLYLPSVALRCG